MTNFGKIRILEPKHDKIQQLRKIWKQKQIEAENSLKEYKNFKGNYYE